MGLIFCFFCFVFFSIDRDKLCAHCRKSALLILKSRLCYLKKKSGNLLTQNYSSILLGRFELITSLFAFFLFFFK